MDQELKQRLIGAVVVTALAAIFIPMLFDDPVDDRSQQVSELAIPRTPAATKPPIPEKAPTDADAALSADMPEGNNVEELNAADEDPLPPIDGSDLDEEGGFDEDGAAIPKAKPGAGAKRPRGDGENVAVIEDTDPEAQAKIDADVEKLRPKALIKSAMEAAKNKEAAQKASPKADAKVLTDEKTGTAKKVVTETVTTKSKTTTVKASDAELLDTPPDATGKPAVTTKTPAAKGKAEPKRWSVQVGSFGKKENAVSLYETLRKEGFPVALDTIQGEKGTLYRLKIGPGLDAKRAAETKAKLEKHKVNSILIAE